MCRGQLESVFQDGMQCTELWLFKFTLGGTPIHLPRCLSGEGWFGPASPTR